MSSPRLALLIQNGSDSLTPLKPLLKELGVTAYSVGSLAEAKNLLSQTEPHLIITERDLSDGSFAQVLEMTEKANVPVNVIVVGSKNSLAHNNAAVTRGAFDFLVAPIDRQTLDDVVSTAIDDVLMRRRQRFTQVRRD